MGKDYPPTYSKLPPVVLQSFFSRAVVRFNGSQCDFGLDDNPMLSFLRVSGNKFPSFPFLCRLRPCGLRLPYSLSLLFSRAPRIHVVLLAHVSKLRVLPERSSLRMSLIHSESRGCVLVTIVLASCCNCFAPTVVSFRTPI